MRVVVPHPTLRVRRGGKDPAARLEDAPRLAHCPDRVGNVLKQVLHHDRVEAFVGKGKGAADVSLDHRKPTSNRGGDGLLGAVDAGVVTEVSREPGVAAADIQEPRLRIEVTRNVPPVAGLLVPVEVAHARATVAHVPTIAAVRTGNVVLNALFLDPSASGGPETYLRGLAPALREVRPEARLTVATTRRGAASLRGIGWPDAGIAVRELPCDEGERIKRQFAEQILLPRIARELRADVLHSLASVAPIRVRGLAHVITLHDVNFIHHATFNPITSWGMRQVIPKAAHGADALIADTVTSRDDVCATLGLSVGAFSVIPLGVDVNEASHRTSERELRARLRLGDGRVALCVGAKRPHKNQAVLIRALRALPSDLRLVLAGHPEPYEASLRSLTRELGLEERVLFADWVSEEDLEGLWSIASVAAFPTLAEGFGLPILEAMARGVPVAASDLPVLREVADDWPVYFDPNEPGDVARAVVQVLEHPPDPAVATKLASRFTWRATAEATWSVYDWATANHRVAGRPT